MFDVLFAQINYTLNKISTGISTAIRRFMSAVWQMLTRFCRFVINHKYKITILLPLAILVVNYFSALLSKDVEYFLLLFWASFLFMCFIWSILDEAMVPTDINIKKIHFYISVLSAFLLASYIYERPDSPPKPKQPSTKQYFQDDDYESESLEPDYHMECDERGCYSDY